MWETLGEVCEIIPKNKGSSHTWLGFLPSWRILSVGSMDFASIFVMVHMLDKEISKKFFYIAGNQGGTILCWMDFAFKYLSLGWTRTSIIMENVALNFSRGIILKSCMYFFALSPLIKFVGARQRFEVVRQINLFGVAMYLQKINIFKH